MLKQKERARPMMMMNARSTRLLVTAVYLLGHFCLLPGAEVVGKDVSEPKGQLAVARQATVNGAAAAKGLVVLSNSRLKTAPEGVAAVELGKAGRLAVGRSADFLLTYSAASVGGRLEAGRVAVTAPAGVTVSISTPHGSIVSDGQRGTDLVAEVVNGQTRVAALNNSDASLTSGGTAKKLSGGAAEMTTKGVVVKAAPKPTTAQPNPPGLSAAELIALISSTVLVGLTIINVVLTNDQRNDIRELLRRTNPSPITIR
jgi:hypothetical protein